MSPDKPWDVAVVGAGIIGAATALHLARHYHLRVIVLDKESTSAAHQTGHNSGVIHSGLYYKPGSLKARLSVEGSTAMVEFCKSHDIPVEVCGKLVVATQEDEVPRLDELQRRGIANGLQGLRRISSDEAREFEPNVRCVAALHVPTTGITQYSLVTTKYLELFQAEGGEVLLGAAVHGLTHRNGTTTLDTSRGDFPASLVINCAGLQSDLVARMAGTDLDLQIVPFRGEYYEIAYEKRSLVRNLIYPVPDPRYPFLGVHFTRRITGEIEAGPNAVLALKREGYTRTSVSVADTARMFTFPGFWKMARTNWQQAIEEYRRSFSAHLFWKSLQKLIPALEPTDIVPAGSGVRAQALDRNGKLLDDFAFRYSPGCIHVCNVPSPAATASLVLGREIADQAAKLRSQ